MSTRYSNNVISKTFAVLKAFTDEKAEWGVHELARDLGIPTSSLHRILKTLRDENMLEVSSVTGKYSFGPEMIRMASIISSQATLKKVAKPFMEKLASTLDESIYLAQYNPSHKKLAFIDSVHGSHALQYVLGIGLLQSITIAASGKAILAFLDEKELEDVFKAENVDKVKRIELKNEIEKIRDDGYIITANERLLGSLSVGAPIFDASEKVIGSIIYTVPVDRFDKTKEQLIIKLVMEETGEISNVLGYKREATLLKRSGADVE
ncbi:IclR family transcriptional regulator [Peribacillus cavernae]|uniref:IclR family transcriptional regulator n=1 Tax=Peribacillus cavernae TaxID=1674310 RepID=A0A433HWR1_9BACI|nr:IclR family transcriptional regulator [Peribacillus cavernae]MDQ0218119.1 DNA-binding IclR family transcriptional regulator [Peribacillus cavernae]RUQ32726.1 IclR family transcriptional regulator [Peribacillus cavernae]